MVQAKGKGFIYDLQTKPFSLFEKRDFFSALPVQEGSLNSPERSEGTNIKKNIVYEINADKSFFYAGAADTVQHRWPVTDAV